MTIFRKIVTEFLMLGIDTIITNSKNDDVSLFTNAREQTQLYLESINCTFFNIRRNPNLAQAKRAELTSLNSKILELRNKESSETEDSITFTKLKEYFTLSEYNIDTLCKNENKNDGNSGILLERLSSFIKYAYKKICIDLELPNTPYNSEALNCMQYYAAKSCTHYIFDERFNGTIQNHELIKDKEELIKAELKQAVKNVTPNKRDSDNKNLIIDRAIAVLTNNNEINLRHRFSIGGSLIISDYLKLYMNSVKDKLSCTDVLIVNESTNSEDQVGMEMNFG